MPDAAPIDVVLLERRNALGYVRALLDCHAAGRVVLPVDDLAADPPAGLRVVDRIATQPGGGWFGDRVAPRHDDAPAQVSLTSGTTGVPKAILLSHRALGDVTDRLVAVMGLDAGVREYVGVPVTYSFGFGRVRAVAAAGGASYLPERGFRIDELAAMLDRGEVNALSAVPTLLRLVLDQKHRFATAGAKLRWLEIGSQPMAAAEKRAVRALFPNARIVQHYGLTEASRTTFLDVSGAPDPALESVGAPNGAVEVRITGDGLVAIRGPHVASGLVTADGLVPLVDAEGWLVTRDFGRFADGCLFYGGRADDLVNVGGIKVSPELFEEQLSARTGGRFAVARGQEPLRGEIVVVAHEGEAGGLRVAVAEVARGFGIGDAFALLPVDALPVTDTGKVRRAEIARLFDAAVAPAPAAAAPAPAPATLPLGEKAEAVYALFVAGFGKAARAPGATFNSLGGDSLAYLSTMIALEELVPALPEDWDAVPVAELAALASPPPPVAAPADDRAGAVYAVFVAAFGEAARAPGATFNSLGGDSLAYLSTMIALEERVPALPEDWDARPVAELAALAAPPPAAIPTTLGEDPAEAVYQVFVAIFGEAARAPGATFNALGGDSLAYLSTMTALEERVPGLPEDWDALPVADLAALADPGSEIARVFVATFGRDARDENASFNALGGDSLAYLSTMTALDAIVPDLPEDWDTMSVAALTALAAEQRAAAASPPLAAADAPAARPRRRFVPTNLDTVRGLTCLMVIALHIVGVGPDEGLKIPLGSPWHHVMDALDLIRMPVFTALAGFLYGAAPARREGYGPFLARKGRQILIPLLFATAVFWVLHGLTYGFTESLFWAYAHSYRHLWYLDALMLMFVVVGAIDIRFAPSWKGWSALIAAIVASFWALPDIYVLQFNNTLFLLPFFIFGILLYRVPQILEARWLIVPCALVVAATIAVQQAFGLADSYAFETGLPTWACGAAAAIVMFHLIPKNRTVERIAPYTYTIYLWHPMANAFVRNGLVKAGLTSHAVLFAIGLVVATLVPIGLYHVMRRFPKWMSVPVIGR